MDLDSQQNGQAITEAVYFRRFVTMQVHMGFDRTFGNDQNADPSIESYRLYICVFFRTQE